ncbi:MAG: AAA family ATPase [Planctomycetaceae bacterium]|nr:AAA family ATPase [Planctomycetaceae bacterium]
MKRHPFLAIPDIAAYYPAEAMESARRIVLQTVERGAGIPLVFGDAGTGKSLLLRLLEQHLSADFSVISIANPRIRTPKTLYQQLLFGLHHSFYGTDENELRLIFMDDLRQNFTSGIVVLVDEAQTLSRVVLEELRVLLHCDDGEFPKIRLVLAGNHRFEENLAHPHLTAFQQRVVARCYLCHFRWDETSEEILWQLKSAGHPNPDSLFPPEARKTVHRLTEGVPRLVHQLCDQVLYLAATSKQNVIETQQVQTAWAMLQQLPEVENSGEFRQERNSVSEGTTIPLPEKGEILQNDTKFFDTEFIKFGTLDDETFDDTRCETACLDTACCLDMENEKEQQHEAGIVTTGLSPTMLEIPPIPNTVVPNDLVCVSEITETFSSVNEQLLETLHQKSEMFFDDPDDLHHIGDTCHEFSENDEIPEKITTWKGDKDWKKGYSPKQSAALPREPKQESCQKLLHELAVMEELLSREISVIHKMKKIENDCLTRRANPTSPSRVLARFPETK